MTWDAFFFSLVDATALKSKDRSVQVGTVIVGPDNEVVSLGFNGFPRGVDDNVEGRHQRPAKYLWTEHAERNAIYNAARCGIALKGCKIYLRQYPCARCARAVIQAGIKEVVLDGKTLKEQEAFWAKRWGAEFGVSREMLKEAGVAIRITEDTRG